MQAVSAVLGLLYLVDSYPGKQTLLSGVALLVYLVCPPQLYFNSFAFSDRSMGLTRYLF